MGEEFLNCDYRKVNVTEDKSGLLARSKLDQRF